MYLRTMTLQALGPFAGEHTIDFAELGASGLYLLEGPTGAGKSTVIDAVVFALYGKVASAATSDDRLRSGYAADDVETFVDLVFETGSGVYRVRRQLERMRAKKRGTGLTRQQAKIHLWRLAGVDDLDGGELLSTRLDEAGLEIQRIVGLDRAQFVQTIVLPQGEFASFLRADPEQRRGLLQKVFGTQVYEGVQVQLAAMRAAARAEVDGARAAVAGAAAHFVGAASVTDDLRFAEGRARAATGSSELEPEPEPATAQAPVPGLAPQDEPARLATASELRALGETADPELLVAARAHATALAHEADEDAATEGVARSGHTAARSALEATHRLADASERRDRLRAEQAELEHGREAYAEAVARCDLARRAAVVEAVLDGADAAARAAAAAQRDLEVLRAGDPDLAELDAAELAVTRERLTAEAARLTRVQAIERGLPARRRELAAQEAALAAAVREHAGLTAEMAQRPTVRSDLVAAMDALGNPGAELATLSEQVSATRERRDAAARVRRLEEQLATARVRASATLDAARKSVDVEAELRRRRLAGMAGELALDLRPGDSCPVCGGVEHPAPAALDDDHPGADQVAAAEADRVRAEAVSAAAATEVAQVAERVAAQRALAGPAAPDQLDAALELLAGQVTAAETAQALLTGMRRELQRHDADSDVLIDRVRTLDVAVTRGRTTVEGLLGAVEVEEKEVDAARVGAPTVAARVAELTAQVQVVTSLASARTAAAAADAALVVRLDELGRGLAEQGFTDREEARSGLLPGAVLRELDATIGAYRAAVARVEAGLREPAVAELPDDVVVDLPGAQAACAAAEQAAAEAARQATLSARCAAAAQAGLAEVRAALAAHAAARAAAEPVTRMADLASASGGDNAMRLTLATYVLARRFEDVVAAANDRLAGMSDGRFELVRSEEREDVTSRKRGLAMKVIDHRLEAERDPRTLSGGETFYVSLCLALGMADVVTAEAGGIDLGTLFVDEGFGTLDPETLEGVLTELGRLRAGGRVVGVVSHVEALKQSIAERIEVRRLPDGSSTLSVRAG